MRRPTVSARACCALLLGALVGAAAPAAAQSLFSGRGLGLVVEPQSARSHALGGVTLGLPGPEISWTNPAGAVGLPVPGLLVSVQTDLFDARYSGRTAEGSTTRFPLVLGAFPLGEKWALTAGFGGFLDQRFAVEQADTIAFGSDTLAVLDRSSSEGGVSRLRLGAAYRIVPTLSAGVGVDVYTGGVQRVAGRVFPDETQPRCCSASFRYSGLGGLASLDWNPSEALSVSLAGTAGGTLEAEPQDSVGSGRSYDLPATATLGATGRVSTGLLLAASAGWSRWSALNSALTSQGGARDTWAVRGGVEWDALEIAGRVVPLRLGARSQQLPFRWGTQAGLSDFATERAISGGTGVVLAGGATRADLGVERGARGREGDGLSETFWRFTFSVSVLGQ